MCKKLHKSKIVFLDQQTLNSIFSNFKIIYTQANNELKYISICNPCPDFPVPSQKHLGMRVDEINNLEGAKEVIEIKKEVLKKKTNIEKRIRLKHKKKERYFKIIAYPIFNHDGDVIGVSTASLDITEYIKAQQQLIHSSKLSALGQLAAGIIHEFKNILATIMGNIQIITTKCINEEVDIPNGIIKHLTKVAEQSKKANDLLSNISALTNSRRPKKTRADIRKIIDKMLDIQEVHFKSEKIEIIRDYNDIPDTLIDINQMEEVFLNLIINARHAIKPYGKGKIYISVKKEKQNIAIRFADTGTGIEKDIQEKIFLPFFTTKSPINDDGAEGGTGLGLSLTKEIIENHNGSIEVKSKKHQGTAFIIKLPIV